MRDTDYATVISDSILPFEDGDEARLERLLIKSSDKEEIRLPYRTGGAVERGVTMTRDVLGATVNLPRARGATLLIVVPHFGVEEEAERTLWCRILDETHRPYV